MEANKVRVIKPDGSIVMLSKTVAENTAFMKKYGYRIEQVKKEKSFDTPPAGTETTTGETAKTEETTTDNASAQEPEKPAETQKPSDKPTRKTGTRKKRNQSK